ncbi:MAG TPA: TlyA family RNA methyltransferase [Methylomusa anaerophila]|uniref:16S/23S rRNA (Cytidine-2'-O)-methyltransferase TlyA n=1 Tax=Methylomusa anaerophila TaxID=1930071 RepID=A0A348APC7_9FIRM|nr:TlyA family RNA methyltransferase [Methylomusa anaerophila]BBB92925.1 16S/23S rRNA (cytidine-2'-O)-methyltransferase TlyA [Methylomusa anaerophila]HML87240.1 TlyA family RNA methyltransferase [Methylomusa anaerophila]
MSQEGTKERLDILLVNKGLVSSRERAKAYIMAGLVIVDGQKIDKAGTPVPESATIVITGDSIGYVSRGGLKLAKALSHFSIDLTGQVMADVGASTGGFTDCALKHNAKKIYAIDVGYGQLAWSLRTDKRVINMERTNIRNVTVGDLGEYLDFVSIDVAFISLDKVLPIVKTLLHAAGRIIALVKPQFEAGREKVGKKGVVKDPIVHIEVITKVVTCARNLNLAPWGLTFSPVKGPEGNIEYLLYLANNSTVDVMDSMVIEQVVAAAHASLTG